MRIAYVITRSHPGGAQSHVLEMIRGLASAHDLALITGENGFLGDEAAKLGAAVSVAPGLQRAIGLHTDALATTQVRRIIEKFAPDIVHSHCSKAGAIGRLAARMLKIPSVYTAHGWRFAPGVAWNERLVAWPAEWIAARLGQHLITVSSCDFNLAVHYKIAAPRQITLIPNGVSSCPWRFQTKHREQVKIVMVARFAPPKDHLLLIRAMQTLPSHVRLTFVGDGPALSAAKAQVIELGLNDRITFLGNRLDVAEILAESDLFVLSSNSEGLPISILEALRTGLPVVATDVGGVRDCVLPNDTGFLVPRHDLNALRDAIATAATSPTLRARMGAAGRKLFERQFTAEVMVQRTFEIYQTLVNHLPLFVVSDRSPQRTMADAETHSGVPVRRESACSKDAYPKLT
jgi:glycosyltransferase involved in cell wall biosynthesis